MHTTAWDSVRGRTQLGMAMAARKPIRATTIMISTKVKPSRVEVLVFIPTISLSVARRELNNRRVNIITVSVPDSFINCLLQPRLSFEQATCQSLGCSVNRTVEERSATYHKLSRVFCGILIR